MICKNCGNEIPDGMDICFICDSVIKEENESEKTGTEETEEIPEFDETDPGYYWIPYHPCGFMDYKLVKRTFILNIINMPTLLLVCWGIYKYLHIISIPILALAIAIYMGPKQMIAQYKVLKHHHERMKKREKIQKQNTSGGNR